MDAKMNYEGYAHIRNSRYDAKMGDKLRGKVTTLQDALLSSGYTEKELNETLLETKKDEFDLLR
jgi:hypothetical protein